MNWTWIKDSGLPKERSYYGFVVLCESGNPNRKYEPSWAQYWRETGWMFSGNVIVGPVVAYIALPTLEEADNADP